MTEDGGHDSHAAVKLYVHGGVSGTPKKDPVSLAPSIAAAERFTTALEAVEAAVARLEDEPALNAGYGAVLNFDGHVELDAGIADGATGRTGAASGVAVRNPIRLARLVMEETPHALMTGAGAMELARSFGLEEMPESTPERRARWKAAKEKGELDPSQFARPDHVDTVGAVALDDEGRLAAASSTGGVFGQLTGRVGDAPVFGAGFFASRAVAVVGTGVGELFIETLACRRVAELVDRGESIADACARVVEEIRERRPGAAAGLLALGADGAMGATFTGSAWNVEGGDGVVEPEQV